MTEKEKLIYFAGIVDGEGHISRPESHRKYTSKKTGIERVSASHSSRIMVNNTNRDLIDWIHENFGGSVRTRDFQTYEKSYKGRLPIHLWSLYGKPAEELAAKLQPYLIVKREQVKRIL